MQLRFEPLTPERWSDLERLFGSRGACGGCWCMAWRKKRADFERDKGEANRISLKALADGGAEPGILAYDGDVPVGWCAVAPREAYGFLERSRVLRRVDNAPAKSGTGTKFRKGSEIRASPDLAVRPDNGRYLRRTTVVTR